MPSFGVAPEIRVLFSGGRNFLSLYVSLVPFQVSVRDK